MKNKVILGALFCFLFSCSSEPVLEPSETLIGQWTTANLADINERRKRVTVLPPPYDPIIKSGLTFHQDGTGYWEALFDSASKKKVNFTYEFVSRNKYQLIWDGQEHTIETYEILESSSDEFTELLIGVSFKDKQLDTNKPIPNKYKRVNEISKKSIVGRWGADFSCIPPDIRRDYPEEFTLEIDNDSLKLRAGLIDNVEEWEAKLKKLPTHNLYSLSVNGKKIEHTFALSGDGQKLYTNLKGLDAKGCHLIRQ